MKKMLTGMIAAGLLATAAANAQETTAIQSLQTTAISDAEAALGALQAGDYAQAASLLQTAERNASQLNLRKISNRLAAAAPGFEIEDPRFALTRSATLSFEEFLQAQNVVETAAANKEGTAVTVRVIADEAAMKKFKEVAGDAAMLDKKGLELAQMAGADAIKKRGDDGALSVLMMSEDDHALIEVEGDSEESVMAFVDALESEN